MARCVTNHEPDGGTWGVRSSSHESTNGNVQLTENHQDNENNERGLHAHTSLEKGKGNE